VPFWMSWDLPQFHIPELKAVEALYLVGDPNDDRVAYVATDKGIYKGISRDPGRVIWTWKPYNDGLPLAKVTKLIPLKDSPSRLRASTLGRGFWEVYLRPPELNN
jgi:hypothetical protein